MTVQTKTVFHEAKVEKRCPNESTPEGVDVLLNPDAPSLIGFIGPGLPIPEQIDHLG